MEKDDKKLTPHSTVDDVFEFLEGAADGAVQVVPISFKEQADDTRLAIFIKGHHETASVIMAELVTTINELFALQEQQEAAENERSAIITS